MNKVFFFIFSLLFIGAFFYLGEHFFYHSTDVFSSEVGSDVLVNEVDNYQGGRITVSEYIKMNSEEKEVVDFFGGNLREGKVKYNRKKELIVFN